MKLSAEHSFRLSSINHFFLDLPYISNVAAEGLNLIDECIGILNQYPQTQGLVYQLENVRSSVFDNKYDLDIVRKELSGVSGILFRVNESF